LDSQLISRTLCNRFKILKRNLVFATKIDVENDLISNSDLSLGTYSFTCQGTQPGDNEEAFLFVKPKKITVNHSIGSFQTQSKTCQFLRTT